MLHTFVLHYKIKKEYKILIVNIFILFFGLVNCGEYRSRTDDLLHAMQAL
jgi:hypothetical protein